MKFIHLSDLHIGKRVNEFSMLEDQKYILDRILDIIDAERPDAVFFAGDIYDKTVPPTEAVELLDDFLFRLSKRDTEVFIISGNHDSADRLAFASRLIEHSGIHISRVYNGSVARYTVEDVSVYLLPFIKPAHVRRFFEDKKIGSYTDAMRTVIESLALDTSKRNILITHQFVTGSSRTESEDVSVGGADNVDAEVFAPFDYVALGHIHRAQNCGSERIRYCGTPLKYSVSEAKDQKSVTVGELSADGQLLIRTVPLKPLREMVELKGTYDELTNKQYYDNTTYREDYVHITLTDEEDIPDAVGKLRTIYKNLMKLDYDNHRTRSDSRLSADAQVQTKSPSQLFGEFFTVQNGKPMNEEQQAYVESMIESVWEG